MTQQLATLIQQVEFLSMDEQLTLIAHLTQKVKVTAAQIISDQVASERPTSDEANISSGKSIRQILDNFSAGLSEETLAQIPTDGAEQHDHYIYGTPKI
jgi:hypothetical protein